MQLDSLVRIGASLQSPDPHALGGGSAHHQLSPLEALQRMLEPTAGWEQQQEGLQQQQQLWDGGVNPLQSAERLLAELQQEQEQAEQQQQQRLLQQGGGRGKVPGAGTWVR